MKKQKKEIKAFTGISKVKEYEIERIKGLLQDSTLRASERYAINVYLKSLLKE